MAEIVTLYHGSKGGLVGDIAPTSRSCCDFGRGFYMGTIPTQPLTLICGGRAPKFYELSFDLEGLRVHRFCENLRARAENQHAYAVRMVDAVKFIDAFLTSKAVEGLDASFDRMQWAGKEYVFQEVMDESGLEREPHPHRYNTEALYYAGWITRYWHYLTGESSREIHAQRNDSKLLQSYGCHSVANELAVENMKADASKNDCLDNGRELSERHIRKAL